MFLCKVTRQNLTFLKFRSTALLYTSQLKRTQEISFQNENLQEYLEKLRLEFYDLRVNASGNASAYARMNQLNGIVTALEQHRALKGNIATQADIKNEKDEDMRKLIEEENEVSKYNYVLLLYLMSISSFRHRPTSNHAFFFFGNTDC